MSASFAAPPPTRTAISPWSGGADAGGPGHRHGRHNSGGIVIAQVERIAERGTLNPRQVKIPGILVDCVVVAGKPEYHMQTFGEPYSPAFSGEIGCRCRPSRPWMSERKIIARRAALELPPTPW
jgi:propionate CoA-transferase